ncbi:MAG: hypothetical protein IH988_01060 [Planctomycetes bacterium]|nr:hypothetical protein [Planctomycetota bacterium]
MSGVLSLVWSSLVFVDEAEFVFVERFGEIVAVYDRPDERGLKFKLPWPIDVTRRFDRRVRLYEPPGREVFTADKKNLTVSAYICWKIAETKTGATVDFSDRPVVRFFRNLASAEMLSQSILNPPSLRHAPSGPWLRTRYANPLSIAACV